MEVELGEIKQIYLSALAMLQPDTDYRLRGVDHHVDPRKLVELHYPIFYPGTQITLADGRQCAAEDLKPGQEVLTHDFAQQKVTCVEIETQRAQGKNRPIRISKSHFGTDHDLILSLAQIMISSSAQNTAFYIPKPMAAMADGSLKPRNYAMVQPSTGLRPVLWNALKYVLPPSI